MSICWALCPDQKKILGEMLAIILASWAIIVPIVYFLSGSLMSAIPFGIIAIIAIFRLLMTDYFRFENIIKIKDFLPTS